MFRALTIHQPAATLVAEGTKPVENRGWATRWRGLVLIHASKTFDINYYEWLKSKNKIRRTPEKFTKGAIIGAAILNNCVPYDRGARVPQDYGIDELSEWHERGRIGWYMSEAVLFEHPIPAVGAQSIWMVPEDLQLWQLNRLDDPIARRASLGPPDEYDPEPDDADNYTGPVLITTLLDQLGTLGGSDNATGRGTIYAGR